MSAVRKNLIHSGRFPRVQWRVLDTVDHVNGNMLQIPHLTSRRSVIHTNLASIRRPGVNKEKIKVNTALNIAC